MPNWAFGYVNVTGTRDGIKSFIERFVAKTILNHSRQAFLCTELHPVEKTSIH